MQIQPHDNEASQKYLSSQWKEIVVLSSTYFIVIIIFLLAIAPCTSAYDVQDTRNIYIMVKLQKLRLAIYVV